MVQIGRFQRVVIILSLQLLFVTGCGSAWIVYQDDNGGVIGYEGPSPQRNTENVHSLIQAHCLDFKKVSDRIAYRRTTSVMPVSTYGSGYGSNGNYANYQETSYVPVSSSEAYYMYEYKCIRQGSSEVANSSQSCEQQCMADFETKKLKPGVTALDCVSLICK